MHIESLDIPHGQKLAIVGPSGSGKTTFLDLVAGIHLPLSGSIRHGETELTQLSEDRRRNYRLAQMGLVFQEFELLEYLTIRDNIKLPYLINRSLRVSDLGSESIEKLAEQVGIKDKLKRRPKQLSQGEKQRVAICRALIHQPKLVLADEPTGNLDASNKARIMDLLIEQAHQSDSTLVVVTHDQSLLDRFDQVIDVSEFEV